MYDQAFNLSVHLKLKSIKHNACLGITCAIRGTSEETIYREQGLNHFNHDGSIEK